MATDSDPVTAPAGESWQSEALCYWLTGLSGAGKTTIGQALAAHLRAQGASVVVLDGDLLREVLQEFQLSHLPSDRRKLAGVYGRLCRMIVRQGISVVCSTISLFEDVHRWNRANIPGYREIYIQAPMPVLISRDRRGVYTNAAGERAANVVGVDLPAEVPKSPDLVITNDGLTTPGTVARMIAETFATRP